MKGNIIYLQNSHRKLACDMENTKAALESERKIQMLQTEAISALWKKVSTLQTDNTSKNYSMTDLRNEENGEIIKHLAQTCTVLQNQVTLKAQFHSF